MSRTYLVVPPEENRSVLERGARWDGESKRWYVDGRDFANEFSRWLPDAAGQEDQDRESYTIFSDRACVAAATIVCPRCHCDTEVISIHCERGTIEGEPFAHFTLVDIWAMDVELVRQLRPWAQFRRTAEQQAYANHCLHCAAALNDADLHSEPEHPFFNIPATCGESARMTPLVGHIRLSSNAEYILE